MRSKKKILIIVSIAATLLLVGGAISFAAWSGYGNSASAVGITGSISYISGMTIKTDDGAAAENNTIKMTKPLYPVDHLGAEQNYWKFELSAQTIGALDVVYAISGSIKNGDKELSAGSAQLCWSQSESKENGADLCAFGSGKSYLRDLPVIKTENAEASSFTFTATVYVYLQALSTEAINADVSLAFDVVPVQNVLLRVDGHKNGEKDPLDGKVDLVNADAAGDTFSVTLTNGSAQVKLLAPAKYNVTYTENSLYGSGQLTSAVGESSVQALLEYKRFESWHNKDLSNFDLLHVNEAVAPFVRSVADGDLGVITRDSYDNVAISVWLSKVKDSGDMYPQKGVVIKFDGENYMMLRVHDNKSIRWDAQVWQQISIDNKYDEFYHLTDEQKTKLYSEGGIKLTLVRKGNMLYTFLEDNLLLNGTKELPNEFTDDKVKVGLWEFLPKADKTWKFDIKEDISVYDSQIPSFGAPTVTAVNGTVAFDKASYKYGERATVTMTPAVGYALYDLNVCGESALNAIEDNVYSFNVTENIKVEATFEQYQMQDVALTVNGHKLGETITFDGDITLTNIANTKEVHTVALVNGTANVTGLITPGRYKIALPDEDYRESTITLAKGDTSASATLHYKRFEAWKNGDLGRLDLSHVNDADSYIRSVANGDLGVITRESYDNVAISVWLKKPNSADSLPQKGLLVKFDGDNYMILRIHNNELLRWDAAIWGQSTIENRETKVCDLNADQKSKLETEGGIKVTLVRSGNILYTFLDGELISSGTKELSANYGDDKVQVGFWEFSPKAGKTWEFEIETDISDFQSKIQTESSVANFE